MKLKVGDIVSGADIGGDYHGCVSIVEIDDFSNSCKIQYGDVIRWCHAKDLVLESKGKETIQKTAETNNTKATQQASVKETDPNGVDAHSPGAKLDHGKLRPYLVRAGFANALHEVWHNGTVGAIKYTDNGWKEVPNAKERYMDAGERHYEKWLLGEERDPETGTHHLGAFAWNILAVLELELTKK